MEYYSAMKVFYDINISTQGGRDNVVSVFQSINTAKANLVSQNTENVNAIINKIDQRIISNLQDFLDLHNIDVRLKATSLINDLDDGLYKCRILQQLNVRLENEVIIGRKLDRMRDGTPGYISGKYDSDLDFARTFYNMPAVSRLYDFLQYLQVSQAEIERLFSYASCILKVKKQLGDDMLNDYFYVHFNY